MKIETLNETALEKIVSESGLQINEGAEIKSAYLPMLTSFAEVIEKSAAINAETPTKQDEKLASELRKKLVKIRTSAEDVKDSRKKIYLIKGNLEQASFNVIKNSCLLAEDSLRNIEEYSERIEAEKKAQLKIQRTALLSEYCDNPEMYPLADITQVAFDDLLNGFKLQKEAKEKAELERIEAERLLAEQKEKDRIAYEAEQERIRVENEKLKKEAELKEKELQKERELAAKKLAEEKEKAQKEADKLRAENDAKLKAEKERADKISAELKAKQDAELKAKKEADELEAKRIADEKKAAKAPDKEKLKAWVNSFNINDIPVGLSNESGTIGLSISNKFDAFKKWANSEIENL